MKKIILTAVIGLMMVGLNSFKSTEKVFEDTAKINWVTIEEAQALAKENPKKIFVDVYAVWCGPCKMMDRNTFTDANVVNYINEHYYAVKFNAEQGGDITFNGKVYKNPGFDPAKTKTRNSAHELTRSFGLRGYPTIVVMNADLSIDEKIVGYRTPEQLMPAIKEIVEG